jgi:hypothetical protein
MLILLPPSEGKAVGGTGRWNPAGGRFGRQLAAPRRVVAGALQTAGADRLGVRGATAERALSANARLPSSPVLPAHERYTGIVFSHLEPSTLDKAARRRAVQSIVVVTGLGGLFAFDDPVPEYRAPIGARLADVGHLARFWSGHLGATIDALADGQPVIDLLPQEHRAALPRGGAGWIEVDLVHPKLRGGHNAKAAKGLLVRALVSKGVAVLDRWEHHGWRADRRTLEK